MHLDYPFHVGGGGRSASTDDDDHVRELVEQVLFTAPGERVMRPSFGSGVAQLVFAPNSTALVSATQMLVQGRPAAIPCQSDRGTRGERRGGRQRPLGHGAVQRPRQRSAAGADVSRAGGRRVVIYTCCDKLRRDAVAAHPPLNGIDYLEVIDGDLPAADPLRQRTLLVYCLRPVTGFTRGNVVITGGA